MEVFVNYPSDEEGIKELSKAVAQFHATLVLKAVDDLNVDNVSKKKIIRSLLDKAKEEAMLEEKDKKKSTI